MKKNLVYAIVLLLIGCGFLLVSKPNIQTVMFTAVCFLFLTFPFTLCIIQFIRKAFKLQKQEDEISLGVGA